MTTKDIRDDYKLHTRWTVAEAAKEAGVAIPTVHTWLSRKRFKRAYVHGPFRVDACSFLRFLETGSSQA